MMLLSCLLSFVTAASAQTPAGALTRIGAAAAVKGAVLARAPGAAVGRVLSSGKPVFLNDHVTTDAAGRLQVMLLDETVFTIGPNSDLVLDEFVYDPATGSGQVAARVTQGVFRFVTGKVARKDPSKMKINLPVGTIGIRGTIAGGQVSPGGSTVILFGPGALNNAGENPGSVSVGNAGGSVVINTPGFGTTVLAGQTPGAVVEMGQQAAQILGSLGEAPQPGGAGGAGGPDAGAGGGQSASQSAGQDTAAGGALASTSGDILSLANAANTTQQVAAQTGSAIADGLSTWDQVRSVETGVGYYSMVGDYTCSGGMGCGAGTTVPGGLSASIDVDFGARTLSNGHIALTGLINDSNTQATTDSFATLTGNAVFGKSINFGPDTGTAGGDFSKTTLSFMNRGGVAAQDLKVDLQYINTTSGTTTATGSATGSFTPTSTECSTGCLVY
ncbi:MAG: FecR domain-containing protein [Elusimicrobia bacterium]|nr:FecR domain-containing protein [Elusimicrobiota bacterium]